MRTEERILSAVDHPFLATLYATIQTGQLSGRKEGGKKESARGRAVPTMHPLRSCWRGHWLQYFALPPTPPRPLPKQQRRPPPPLHADRIASFFNTVPSPPLSTSGQCHADSHLHFLLEYCGGGELYALLNAQPAKRLAEDSVRFYACEVMLALQYLHLQGFVYR